MGVAVMADAGLARKCLKAIDNPETGHYLSGSQISERVQEAKL
jgi:hypothetical protein